MGKKLLSAFVNLLCLAAILLSLAAGWTAISTPKGQAPALFGYSMLTVLTGSMEPTLPQNSLILVREISPTQIRAGDIITFYTSIAGYSGVINTHRVVEITEEGGRLAFRTQGDANPLEDSALVPGSQVIGTVFFCSLPLGVAVSFLRQPVVFLLLILVPLLLIILRSALGLIRMGKEEVRRAQRELEEARHEQEEG